MRLLLLLSVLVLLVGCGGSSEPSSAEQIASLKIEGRSISTALHTDALQAADDPVPVCARLDLWRVNVLRQGAIVDELRALGEDVHRLAAAMVRVRSTFVEMQSLCDQLR